MNISAIRDLFLGTRNKTYLDSAAVGISPSTAKASILEYIDLVSECSANDVSQVHIFADQAKKNALEQISILLKTNQSNIALINNTSHGLNIACNSIPWQKNDEIIICETEYLQVAIPFLKKQEKGILKIVDLQTNNGLFSWTDFEKSITKSTKAICISAVQWCTGQRLFTKKLGEYCRENNIWLIVDGVQEAGALNVDLTKKYCDFYIAGGHKWLNSPYGCGFIYMSPKAQNLEPTEFGYLNLNPPTGGWNEYFQSPNESVFKSYDFPKKTQSFCNGGTPNAIGAIGLYESIKIVNKIGIDAVEARILHLAQNLRANLEKIGARLSNCADSGITIFSIPEKNAALMLERLKQQRIFISIRYGNGHGGIRASTHYFNNEEDIDKLCWALTTKEPTEILEQL